MATIGIDFGTRASCVGILNRGRVDILETDTGARTIPSFVAFTETGRLFGEAAASQASVNPLNTVYDIKRLFGRQFSDPSFRAIAATWPFRVVCGDADEPLVEVTCRGEVQRLSAVQLCGMFLGHLRSLAEAHLGSTVARAAVSAPGAGGLVVRSALVDACAIARLAPAATAEYAPMLAARQHAVLRGLRAAGGAAGRVPQAADDAGRNDHVAVLIDAGASGCDIVVTVTEQGVVDTVGHAYCAGFGGSDVDAALVEVCAAEFARAAGGRDVRRNPKAMSRLRVAAERAKHQLSGSKTAVVEVDCLLAGTDFRVVLTQAHVEAACADGLGRLPAAISEALRVARQPKEAVAEVVLLGGASRVPGLQVALRDFFRGRELAHTLNADEAVAAGAALATAPADILVLQRTFAPLGVAAPSGLVPVFPAFRTIPASASAMIRTAVDGQAELAVEVFEGFLPAARNNRQALVLAAVISGLPPRPRGFEVPVDLDIEADGSVSIACRLPGTAVRVLRHATPLTPDARARLIEREQRWEVADLRSRATLDLRASLEAYAFAAKRAAEGTAHAGPIGAAADTALEWLEATPLADFVDTEAALAALQDAVRTARLPRPPPPPARVAPPPPLDPFDLDAVAPPSPSPAGSASRAVPPPRQAPPAPAAAPPPAAWSCAACTFLNENLAAAACAVCESPRADPARSRHAAPAGAASAAPTGVAANGAGGSAAEPAPRAAGGRRRASIEAERLQGELERVLAERQCAVCEDRPKDTAFGCGHRLCGTCAVGLAVCPFCRQSVTLRIKIFD